VTFAAGDPAPVSDCVTVRQAGAIGSQRGSERSDIVLRRRKLRRTIGALFVVAGGVLMWFAPASTFVPLSAVGIVLLACGIVVEALGIALERRDPTHESRRRPQ
jgi:uncharacterized membrane protein HdeD (DUF308 family)